MRLVFCRTASRLAYLAYVTRGLLRRRWTIPGIDLAYSTSVSCSYRSPTHPSPEQRKIYVEADGELPRHSPGRNHSCAEPLDAADASPLDRRRPPELLCVFTPIPASN